MHSKPIRKIVSSILCNQKIQKDQSVTKSKDRKFKLQILIT